MSKVGEPMDLTKEINEIKSRLENLEHRILTMDTRLGPKLSVIPDFDFSKIKVNKNV